MVKLPADEDTPEKRVAKIFAKMDKAPLFDQEKLSLTAIQDNDGKLTMEEFREGSKNDPSIVQVRGRF